MSLPLVSFDILYVLLPPHWGKRVTSNLTLVTLSTKHFPRSPFWIRIIRGHRPMLLVAWDKVSQEKKTKVYQVPAQCNRRINFFRLLLPVFFVTFYCKPATLRSLCMEKRHVPQKRAALAKPLRGRLLGWLGIDIEYFISEIRYWRTC